MEVAIDNINDAMDFAADVKDMIPDKDQQGTTRNKNGFIDGADINKKLHWIDEILYLVSFLKTDMRVVRRMIIPKESKFFF